MLDPAGGFRVFGVPPGADFPAALARALMAWAADRPPEALARATVFANTGRMQRRIRAALAADGARLLPRLRLVAEIGHDTHLPGVPASVPPLRRVLDLTRLIAAFIERDPSVAPRMAAFALAQSLAQLLDEMQAEGVAPETLGALDIVDQSGHWARSLAFLKIVQDWLAGAGHAPDPQARQRLAIERLIAGWQAGPPVDPVIVAGSTGSRGPTLALMAAVARLPQGALVLPGFDFAMPEAVWAALGDAATGEDHPQFRYARLLAQLGMSPVDVAPLPGAVAPDPDRNRLVSLALRPAPVTDQWLRDGPGLGDPARATQAMTLVEAPGPRAEAQAIALILRQAAEERQSAALITPDRMLTRRVTACLDRWGIEPDDSAGRPLALSPPGRFLRHVAALMRGDAGPAALLPVLKHPLCHSGANRGDHLLRTHELELWLRRRGAPHADAPTLRRWAGETPAAAPWAEWVATCLERAAAGAVSQPLTAQVDRHIALAETLAAGGGSGAGQLWEAEAGRAARDVMAGLQREAGHGGSVDATEYQSLFQAILGAEQVRVSDPSHPELMIWGTLEARVQGADLVILGGLNDGTWPEQPAPDPWLNRRMRLEAGLLLPERQTGLSAHDFQQAVAARQVVLTRSLRDADAEPVPSRWLNRLTNLLGGLPDQGGPGALAAMRERGALWLDRADRLERPVQGLTPACRPAPRPPVAARPRKLSVTGIERLIRDPYAVYARHMLGLRPLDPLVPRADAAIRGVAVHRIFDRFMRETPGATDPRAHLMRVADAVLAETVPWPAARRLWHARIDRVADWFLRIDAGRGGHFLASEVSGETAIGDFTLHARADRIDRMPSGALEVLDYKTGTPPTAKAMAAFDVQLLLEALIAEAGGFEGIPAAPVEYVAHIGLGAEPVDRRHALVESRDTDFRLSTVRAKLDRLIAAYDLRDRGYTARRAMQRVRFEGDYDHLARFGEWTDSDPPVPEDVG